MSLLQACSLSLRYAQEHPLFQAVNFDVNPGDRIAVVGPNGAGKSSLLRILSGDQPGGGGQIVRRRGLLTAHYAQREEAESGRSAGQWAMDRLVQLLAGPADVLLLDEPTNHLDEPGRQWLAHQLIRHSRTCLFVSHDEDFLSRLATRVFELRRGQFVECRGGYNDYLAAASGRRQSHWAAFEQDQKRIAALDRAAQRRDSLAAKVADTPPGGRISRAFYNAKAAKVARTARLLRERMPGQAQIAKPWEEQPIPVLDFAAVTRSGDPPLAAADVALPHVEARFDFTVRRGDRWAIHGPNGSGKTTFFRAILGHTEALQGRLQLGVNVKIGYFAQEAETLHPDETPLEVCLRETNDRTWVQTILACLKLPRGCVNAPIGRLSLGERAKTAIAQVLVSGANLLLLDEPTNHLELEARHALIETLRQFPGTILFASHDSAFSSALATETYSLDVTRRAPVPRLRH